LGLGKGSHKEMMSDLKNKKIENAQQFNNLISALTEIYNCSETDVDKVLEKYSGLQASFQTGAKVEVFLKVIKWMFIMEDIVYWNYKGRTKLYEALIEETK
jgi:hypothetical protein